MDLNITIRAEKELIMAIESVAKALSIFKPETGEIKNAEVEEAQKTAPAQAKAETPEQTEVPKVPTVPTTEKEYTLDELSKAAVSLMDLGKQTELLDLLAQFGVQSMPQLQKGQYGAFATALRDKGANI